MTNQKAVAEKLLQVNAIQLNLQSPYTWASGWKSPIYCDNRKVLAFPFVRDFIKAEMCNMLFDQYPDAEMLAGVATAGIAWGAIAADQLKLPFVYVRPTPKAHGLGNQIEGSYETGRKVVVIEDLVSTGKSSLQVVNVLREAGLNVSGMVSIFTYGFEEGKRAMATAGIDFQSLTTYQHLVALALEKGYFTGEQQTILLKWQESPSTWTGH